MSLFFFFFFQAEDGIRDYKVTGVQTCALPIFRDSRANGGGGPRRRVAHEIASRQRDDEGGRHAGARPPGEHGVPRCRASVLGARQYARGEDLRVVAGVERLSQRPPEHQIGPVIERQWILHPSSFQSARSTRKRRRAWNTSDRTVPSGIPRIRAISPCG